MKNLDEEGREEWKERSEWIERFTFIQKYLFGFPKPKSDHRWGYPKQGRENASFSTLTPGRVQYIPRTLVALNRATVTNAHISCLSQCSCLLSHPLHQGNLSAAFEGRFASLYATVHTH